MMEIEKILSYCDHTLLSVDATWEEIREICDDGMHYRTASVCIPPCFVRRAKEYVGEHLRICTVIGFPNGYMTEAVKVFEAQCAIADGADEIDMVINVGDLKSGRLDAVASELRAMRAATRGYVLKVIIETCLLTDEEKRIACRLVTEAEADFIKTSTGFSKGGATREDVALLRANVGERVKVKAAGGIASIADAEAFLALGAERLGTSRIVKLCKAGQASGESGGY